MKSARLEKIIHRMNRAFARRKSLGLPTAHLLHRAPLLTSAYLAARHDELTSSRFPLITSHSALNTMSPETETNLALLSNVKEWLAFNHDFPRHPTPEELAALARELDIPISARTIRRYDETFSARARHHAATQSPSSSH